MEGQNNSYCNFPVVFCVVFHYCDLIQIFIRTLNKSCMVIQYSQLFSMARKIMVTKYNNIFENLSDICKPDGLRCEADVGVWTIFPPTPTDI